jgi:hypothetical protein
VKQEKAGPPGKRKPRSEEQLPVVAAEEKNSATGGGAQPLEDLLLSKAV